MPDNALGNSRPPQVPPGAQSQQVFVSWFPQLKFGYEPGTNTEYSNIGFAILGLALERAAGVPYVDYIKNEILIPLGMTHTGFTLTPDMAARLAKGYSLTPTGILAGPLDLSTSPDGPPYLLPAGGLFSTVGDMAKFTAFQLGYGPNSVLSKQSLQNNFLQVATASGDLSRGTGVGFSVNRSGGAVRVGHDGGLNTTNGGFEASAQMRLEADVGVIFLRNLTRRDRFGSDFKFAVLDAVSPRGLPLSADSKLINTSTRGQVGADGVGLIAGFVVDGGVPIQALVRAVGPTLTAFGVSGALADPTLTVYDNRGRVIADNDNWGSRGDSAAIANAASQVGAFGLRAGSSDSALLVTLPPGTYTVRATGAGGATGTALIEIYGVP
jgi:CubicO group peptidase (beta-lactamase class C family)